MTDTRVIDVLLLKGRQEYQETLNCWKQLDHIMGILLAPRGRPQRTFLQKFYEGAYRRLCSVGWKGRRADACAQGGTRTRCCLLRRVSCTPRLYDRRRIYRFLFSRS